MKDVDRIQVKSNCTSGEIELVIRERNGITSASVWMPLSDAEQFQQRVNHAVDCIKRIKKQ